MNNLVKFEEGCSYEFSIDEETSSVINVSKVTPCYIDYTVEPRTREHRKWKNSIFDRATGKRFEYIQHSPYGTLHADDIRFTSQWKKEK